MFYFILFAYFRWFTLQLHLLRHLYCVSFTVQSICTERNYQLAMESY